MSTFSERIERILAALAEACCGNFDFHLDISHEEQDEFQSVEVGFNTLLTDLAAAKARSDAQIAEITHQSLQLRESQAQLLALSAPISIIWPRVLLMPIIGSLDVERARYITETLLNRIVSERATDAILDLTGAGSMDAATAQSLLRMAGSVSLLGSECIITGLSSEMAKKLVELNQDLGLRSLPRLSDALASIIAKRSARGKPQ